MEDGGKTLPKREESARESRIISRIKSMHKDWSRKPICSSNKHSLRNSTGRAHAGGVIDAASAKAAKTDGAEDEDANADAMDATAAGARVGVK